MGARHVPDAQEYYISENIEKMVDVAGVEPTLARTATRICSGLPNVY